MEKKKIFYIFLFVSTLLWSICATLRNVISIDAIEAICWGNLIDFGTNKHPPLSGWLAAGSYNLFGQHDFVIYILGQICILVGFIYIYRLAKFFLSEEKAFCSVMILQACAYYTYFVFIDNFNCNVLLMALWPMCTFYFYKSIRENKLLDWVLFGVVSGLGFLGKYQIVFLFFAMLLYLIFIKREQFRQKGMYIAILTGLLVILPHVIWLYKTDFFSFSYMIGRTHSHTNNLPEILTKLSHLFYPLKFVGGQIGTLAGCFVLYFFTIIQTGNFNFKNIEGSKSDKLFLLLIFFVPILTQGFMGFVTGDRVPAIWGSIMVGFVGIMMFYFLPVRFKEDTFKFFTKLSYAAMVLSSICVCIFALLQTQFFISYPYQKIMPDFEKMWAEETANSPLKYVGGDIGYIFQFAHYNPQKPKVILETFGHKNPWIDHEDVLNSGAIIVGEHENMTQLTKSLIILLPTDYKVTSRKYTAAMCNILGKCEQREFFYTIVPPFAKSN